MKLTTPSVLSSLKQEAKSLREELRAAQVPLRATEGQAQLEQVDATPFAAAVDPTVTPPTELEVLRSLQGASRRLDLLPAQVYDRLAVAERLVGLLAMDTGGRAATCPPSPDEELRRMRETAEQMKTLDLPGELSARFQALADQVLLATRDATA